MEPGRQGFEGDIEATFARIAAGSRIIAAVWMAILGVITLARDAGVSTSVVLGAIVLGLVWALAAGVIAYPDRALSRGMLAVDLVVGVLSLLAPELAGTGASFYGGLPLIIVAIAALRGRLEGLVTALVLVVVAVGTIVSDISFTLIIGETTLIFAYVGVGILVAWIGDVLRQAEARLVEANVAVAEARATAAREAERADIGRHLHDSVLQTLALIQRDSNDPQRVTIQARRQERELRDWLFGSGNNEEASGFEEGLRRAAADVEERFEVTVDVVVVGDSGPSPAVSGLVAAATEAMNNAARHAGVDEVDVYGEAAAESLVVYVRDRGVGFDPDAVPSDRQGVRNSIVGRLAALGGESIVKSSPERGTEWRMTMPTERIETDVR